MAAVSSSFLVNKVTAIVLIVVGFLILASGYRYDSASSVSIGYLLLAVGVLFLILKIVRRNSTDSTG